MIPDSRVSFSRFLVLVLGVLICAVVADVPAFAVHLWPGDAPGRRVRGRS